MSKPQPKSKFVRAGHNLQRYLPTGTYYARLKFQGKIEKHCLDTNNLTTAKLRLADFEKSLVVKAANRAQAGRTEDGGLSFDGALKHIEEENERKPIKESSREFNRQVLLAIRKTWPETLPKNVNRITRNQCQDWAYKLRNEGTGFQAPGTKTKKVKGLCPSRYNRAVSFVEAAFEYAIQQGCLHTNPMVNIPNLKARPKALQLPTREQFKQFCDAIENGGARQSKGAADLVRFLAFSGCRIDEAIHVTFRNINWETNNLTIWGHPINRTKNDKSRVIPMTDNLRALLEKIKNVHPSPKPDSAVLIIQTCTGAMTRAALKVGIKRITHHDLRHLFATTCIESGVDIPTVSRWLGHSDGGALAMKTYGHLRNEHSSQIVKRVKFD